jgi:hypothetical protein
MDRVMRRLGIKVASLHGKDVRLVVHCNLDGKPMGGGMNNWLTTLKGYTLKLSPVIDEIQKQPIQEL